MPDNIDDADGEYTPFFNYLNDGDRDQRPGVRPNGALSLHETSQEELQSILIKVLKDLPVMCPKCSSFCPDHAIDLRDAFIRRLREISLLIVEGADVYFKCRKFGIAEPEEVIEKIYSLAAEHSVVYALAEPYVYTTEEETEDSGEEE